MKKRTGETNDNVLDTYEMWRQIDSNPPSKIGEGEMLTSVNESGFVGYNIPNFHSRKRRGELLPHTPWSKWKRYTTLITSTYDITIVDGTTYTNDAYVPGVGSSNPDVYCPTVEYCTEYAQDARGLVQEAAADIYTQGFDALTFVAELTDVFHMFRSLCKKVGSMKLPPPSLRGAASGWLEARYGWRPLIYDMIAIEEALNSVERRTRHTARRRSFSSDSEFTEGDPQWNYSYELQTDIQYEISVKLVGSVTADIIVPKVQFNPMLTAWEIIPFSFVLDWFVSIGKTLAAWSFLTNTTKYASSYGCLVSVKKTRSRYMTGNTNQYFYSGTDSQNSVGVCEVEHRVPCSVPITPHFNLYLNSFKVVDLIAMVVQRLKRR